MSSVQLKFDYTFDYQEWGNFLRPIIPVTFYYQSLTTGLPMLVDSGSVDTAIPLPTAEYLNIDISELDMKTGTGAGGPFNYYEFQKQVQICIATENGTDIEFGTPLIITTEDRGYGILGQNMFFQTFRIAFQEKEYYKFHISFDTK